MKLRKGSPEEKTAIVLEVMNKGETEKSDFISSSLDRLSGMMPSVLYISRYL